MTGHPHLEPAGDELLANSSLAAPEAEALQDLVPDRLVADVRRAIATTPSHEVRFSTVRVLPVYLVLDASMSMRTHETLLNETVREVLDTFSANPLLSDFFRVSIVAFAAEPQVILKMTGPDGFGRISWITTGGPTNFGPLFDLMYTEIEEDIRALRQEALAVLRPVVFLLTDGAPTDSPAERWQAAHRRLTDPTWKPHPRIITYGFGDASESILAHMATSGAFIADGSTQNTDAVTQFMSSMTNSLVASAVTGKTSLPHHVPGYRTVTV